jgi:hypothetical protein
MNKILIILVLSVFALLYSCGDDAQSNQSAEDGSLYITVQDAYNGNLLADAKATLGSTESTTDNTGRAMFKLQAGTRTLLVEKENYASVRKFLGTDDRASGGVSIVSDRYESVPLYPATARLKGTLYYTNSKGQSVPMPEVPIRIDFTGGNLATTSYSCGKTNDKGEYECENLPAINIGGYTVYSLGVEIDGVIYAPAELGNRESFSLLPGIVASNGRTNYSAAAPAFLVLETPQDIEIEKKSEPLTLKFSEAVDINQFNSSWILATQGVIIEWEACVENACTQLKLTPLPNWQDYTEITLGGIKSISNKTLTSTIKFNVLDVDLSGEQVIGIKVQGTPVTDTIHYRDLQAEISWNKLAGATSYNVFVKTSDTASTFEKYGPFTDTTQIIYINRVANNNCPSNNCPIGGKTNKVFVQASNSRSTSLLSASADIKAKDDEKAPTFADPTSMRIIDPCYTYTINNGTPRNYKCVSGYMQPPSTYYVSSADGIIYFYERPYAFLEPNGTYYEPAYLYPSDFVTKYKLANVLAMQKDTIITYGRVFFNKPMKTSPLPTVECTPSTAAACAKLKLEPKWNNDQNLNLTVKTVAGNAVAGATDVVFSIKGLKGLNDKDFVTDPSAVVPINAVKFQFKTDPVCGTPAVYPCVGYCSTTEGRSDYTNCLAEACNYYGQGSNSNCPGYYCTTPTGQADFSSCPNEYCSEGSTGFSSGNCDNNCAGWLGVQCDNFCSAHYDVDDYEDEDDCVNNSEWCGYHPSNTLCQ